MRTQTILLTLLASLTASGCQQIECADGTIERDGKCEPPDKAPDVALCGPFTELVGDRCVPMFPPTECDPSTTDPETDPDTGVTTCIGRGGPTGCTGPLACPTPTGSTKQTICGQIWDFVTNQKFAAADATGARCDPASPTATGPCSLTITAYNAAGFAMGDTTPLSVGDLWIDDCGRYRVQDIEVSTVSLAVGLGVDDIAAASKGPLGVTVTAAVAANKAPMSATNNLEAFVTNVATVQQWSTAAGTNLLSTGIYAPVFRAHKVGAGDQFLNQSGVVAMKGTVAVPDANSFYFQAAQSTRETIDNAQMMTGMNGTVLINNASLSGAAYTGMGGITDTANCTWEQKPGASVAPAMNAGVLFIQVFRKTNITGKTCNE